MGIPFITPFWVAKNGSLNTTRSDPFLVHFVTVAANRICDCFFQKTVSWGDEGTFKFIGRRQGGGGVCNLLSPESRVRITPIVKIWTRFQKK